MPSNTHSLPVLVSITALPATADGYANFKEASLAVVVLPRIVSAGPKVP
jgi:hypothetical protein